jgi:hypothetical protein
MKVPQFRLTDFAGFCCEMKLPQFRLTDFASG